MDKLAICMGIKKGLIKTGVFCACIFGAGFHFSSEISMVNAEENVEINETNFPNKDFRGFVRKYYDTNEDGFLSKDERNAVTVMDIDSVAIGLIEFDSFADMRGIEYFTNLTQLTIYNAAMEEIDLSSNTKLEKITFRGLYKLKKLDLRNNTELTYLDVSDEGALESLDVSGNVNLKSMDCHDNKLKSLDVSNCTQLDTLICSGNRLKELDVTKNILLADLMCQNNMLQGLDISNNTSLGYLDCSYNNIKELNSGDNDSLYYLKCNHNQLTSLKLNKCLVSTLVCQDNMLDGIDESALKNIEYLYCWNNDFESLNIGGVNVNWYNEPIYFVPNETENDMENYNSYTAWGGTIKCDNTLNKTLFSYDKIGINETNFPDSVFREDIVRTYDTDKDGYLSKAECDKVTVLSAKDKGISNLQGIEYFTALESLSCSQNQIPSIDVSKNVYLKKVYCENNPIKKLDFRNNQYMEEIDCSNCNLVSLDVSANNLLEALHCNNNQLTNLNVGNSPDIEFLYCDNNQIAELDVSDNVKLYDIGCSNNSLSELYVSKNINLTNLRCDGNELTKLDIKNNTKLTNLNCNNNKLTVLKLNTQLSTLSCAHNKLMVLDLSDYQDMYYLECYDNNIYSIITDGPFDVTIFYCWKNSFDSLEIDLKNGTNTKLFPSDNDFKDVYKSYTDWGGSVSYNVDDKELVITSKDDSESVESTMEQRTTEKYETTEQPTTEKQEPITEQLTTEKQETATEQHTDQPASVQPKNEQVSEEKTSDNNIGKSETVTEFSEKLPASISANNFKKTYGSKSFLIGASTNSDGVLQYSSDNIRVVSISAEGRANITGCGKANIIIISPETDKFTAASESVTVTVLPGKLKIKKINSPKSSQIKISWAKMRGASFYQYSISGSKKFTKAQTFKTKTTSVRKKAKGASGRRFFVRVRAVAKIDGKKYYGKWSSTKSVTVK